MSKRIDKLKSLMEEYKKIKGMYDGGQTGDAGRRVKLMTNKDQEDQDLENEIGATKDQHMKDSLYKLKDKNWTESREMLGYDEGGKVETDNPLLPKISDAIRKITGTKAKVPPDETREQRNERIRQDNSERAQGKRPSLESMDSDYDTKTMYYDGGLTGYADGTEEPIQPEDDLYPPQDIKDPDKNDESDVSDEAEEGDKSEKDLENEAATGGDEEPDSYVEEEGAARRAERDIPDVPSEDKNSTLQRLLASQKPAQSRFTASDLEKAQHQRAVNEGLQGVLRGGALIGAGVARANPQQALSTIAEGDKYTGKPVQDYEEQLKNQENDPNSEYSKAYAQSAAQFLGIDPEKLSGTSAKVLDKSLPLGVKKMATDAAIQKVSTQLAGKKEIAELGAKTKVEEGEKNRVAADKRQQSANAAHIAAAKLGQENKKEQRMADDQIKAETDINSTRGKQALMIAQRNLMAVKNAQKMIEEFPDTDKWTPQQVGLFNTEIAKIAQGGVPAEGQIKELSNPTAASSMASFAQKVANVPIGAQQGEFIKLNEKYLKGLSDVSNQTIKDNLGNTIKSHQSKLGPDAYKNILYRHSDMLGVFTPAQERGINAVMQTKGLSREDAVKALVQQKLLPEVNY